MELHLSNPTMEGPNVKDAKDVGDQPVYSAPAPKEECHDQKQPAQEKREGADYQSGQNNAQDQGLWPYSDEAYMAGMAMGMIEDFCSEIPDDEDYSSMVMDAASKVFDALDPNNYPTEWEYQEAVEDEIEEMKQTDPRWQTCLENQRGLGYITGNESDESTHDEDENESDGGVEDTREEEDEDEDEENEGESEVDVEHGLDVQSWLDGVQVSSASHPEAMEE